MLSSIATKGRTLYQPSVVSNSILGAPFGWGQTYRLGWRQNGGMPLFASGPDKSLVAELAALVGHRVDVLAWGEGAEATILATRTLLALRSRGEWHTWGWEEIASGAWRADSSAFRWTTTAGEKLEVALDDVGRLPELFQERVQASTVASETHELTKGRVQIVGRRTLDGADAIKWYATASAGASLADPATAAFVVDRTDQLADEYR